MERLIVQLTILIICVSFSFGQDSLPSSYYLNPTPWAGDWLRESYDQMVHGEEYNGFPGPLPKYWAFGQGLDPMHPSVDFELQERVVRDSVHWAGSCNGWSAAAILFPEPEPIVVDGVKFMASDQKALLASIWKDNQENTVGEYEDSGITASSFEAVLELLATGFPLIFDVTLGIESWNYPVVGFNRELDVHEDYTDVTCTIRYANTVILKILDEDFSTKEFLDLTYTYRYTNLFPRQYEWTGDSIRNQPDRAWYPTNPLLPGSWFSRANRYLSMAGYFDLLERADDPLSEIDLFEPNDAMAESFVVETNLVMGSLQPGDTDFFRFPRSEGQGITLECLVYDGPALTFELLGEDGSVLGEHVSDEKGALVVSPDHEGDVYVRISGSLEDPTAFYQIVIPKFRSYLSPDPRFAEGGMVSAIPIRGEAQLHSDRGTETMTDRAMLVQSAADKALFATGRVIWGYESFESDRVRKLYHRDHDVKSGYRVPHISCRNGWKTIVDFQTSSGGPATLRVFDNDGTVIFQQLTEPSDHLDLAELMGSELTERASWFEFVVDPHDKLYGEVQFVHDGAEYRAGMELQALPRHHEMTLHSIPNPDEGWLGMAIVNATGENNEILWRLVDGLGDVLEDGIIYLGPNQKWLGLPKHLADHVFEKGDMIRFFAQFPIETLALRRDQVQAVDYLHRFPNKIQDHVSETFVTPTQGVGVKQEFVFFNNSNRSNYVLLQAYSAEGVLLDDQRIQNRPFRRFEVATLDWQDIVSDFEVETPGDITHVRVISQEPIVFYELIGSEDSKERTFVRTMKIFDNP